MSIKEYVVITFVVWIMVFSLTGCSSAYAPLKQGRNHPIVFKHIYSGDATTLTYTSTIKIDQS
jgi:hypothetical protein